jgi:hydroxymethylpyrimidine pyrophosphatase-like HAD family hydrolase
LPAVPKADPNLGRKAKPGFTTKFERGAKRRETIRDKFDDNGNMIERTDKMFNKYGEVMKKNRYTYKYDDAGRRIEQWYYATEDNGAPIMSNVNYLKYNEKGWKIENLFISYGAEGEELRWVRNEFSYNNDGRIIEDVTFDKEGIRQFKVNYNIVDGFLVSENFTYYDENGEPITKKTISYDEVGTVIGEKEESLK